MCMQMVHKRGSMHHMYVQTYPVASSKSYSIKCLCLHGSDQRIYNSGRKGLQAGWKVGSNESYHILILHHQNMKTVKL